MLSKNNNNNKHTALKPDNGNDKANTILLDWPGLWRGTLPDVRFSDITT